MLEIRKVVFLCGELVPGKGPKGALQLLIIYFLIQVLTKEVLSVCCNFIKLYVMIFSLSCYMGHASTKS